MENSGERSGEELHNYESEPEAPIPLLTIVEKFIERATRNWKPILPDYITLKVLNHFSKFSWDDKAGLTLAAFALTFGDFWLLVRIYAHNVVNEPMTGDQRELMTSTNKEAYRNQIEANNEFIKMLVNALRYLFDITVDKVHRDRGPIYVYWIVRCVIAAATQIIVLSNKDLISKLSKLSLFKFKQNEAFATKLCDKCSPLKNQLQIYLVGIRTPIEVEKLKSLNGDLIRELSRKNERERVVETYVTKLLSYPVDDIIEFMRIIITDKDMPPLYHGVTKRKDHLDVLRGKRVLLLISEIDMFFEDITSLKHVIIDTKKDEIVWIPVINRSIADLDPINNQLEILQNSMPWYSVQPSMVTDVVIDFFKIEWKFKPKTILYLLSPSGEILRYDAIDMIQEERYIILYGGNDIDWIRRFTRQVNSVASDLQGRIEMVYEGNRHDKDRGHGVQNVILIEQLSHCLPKSSMTYFWTRFDSMFESKRAYEDWRVPKDILLQEMLRFRIHENWALLARGSTILVNGSGQIALNVLEDMEKWRTKMLQSLFYFGSI
ncbi:protein SIEVE ELEMENT OCCLUSION B-like [Silene latifolia]|uniref:protein SIEVE ELEMENT OCCLUSION B-like n=1 Tax=Silene latifolia TaxID=37657 RepID=UPI003D787F58